MQKNLAPKRGWWWRHMLHGQLPSTKLGPVTRTGTCTKTIFGAVGNLLCGFLVGSLLGAIRGLKLFLGFPESWPPFGRKCPPVNLLCDRDSIVYTYTDLYSYISKCTVYTDMYVYLILYVSIPIYIGGWGGEPTGKSFRFVRACVRARRGEAVWSSERQ